MFLDRLLRRAKTESANDFGVAVKTNVRYGDYKNAVCDVYRLGEGRLPVIVHFIDEPEKRDRAEYAAMASAIAAKGRAFVVAGLSGESRESTLNCAKQMSEYLKLAGAGEKLDVNAVFFSGDGTGAWTALKAAGAALREEKGFPVKPVGVMLFSGVVEPLELARLDMRAARSMLKYGFGIQSGADRVPESAVNEITSDFPPVFFLHSDYDNISYSQTAQLRTALKRAATGCSEYRATYKILKRDFYLEAGRRAEADSALEAVKRFSDKCLSGADFANEYTEI